MSLDGGTRRRFLAVLGTGGFGLVAGCAAPTGSQLPSDRAPPGTAASTGRYTWVFRQVVDSVVLVQAPGLGGGQGSGFVFDGDGRVLTNQHVVESAAEVDVRFADGTWRPADVVGTDVYSDLAVLAPADRPPGARRLPLVDASPPIGTEVAAIGSPFGLEESLTTGVVSGVDRAIATRGGFTIPDAVQTDAAVNPGNSGGPLVTLAGEVVGVIRSGGGENIGFAISAALVRRVAPALVADGSYEHAYLGIAILDVTPTVAEANDLDRATGVLVADVLDGGPADGVLLGSDSETTVDGVTVPTGGDVIVALDGRPVASSGALGHVLALRTRPGDVVPVDIVRDGVETTVDVELGTRPPP